MKQKLPLSVSLVIPLYNNKETLVEQLQECLSILKNTCEKFEIVIAEDKSTDDSRAILKKNFSHEPFKIIYHKKNLGIANTIKELYAKAKMDYVLLFSVDGDWDPKDIKGLLLERCKNKSNIIIGKRNPQNYTFYRKLISFFYNLLPVLLFGVKTIDAGSIKVIDNKIIKETRTKSKSVFFEAELLIKASKKGYKISSIPVYFKKRKRDSGSGADLNLVFFSIRDLFVLRLS